MKKQGNISSYTVEELKKMQERGETRTNWEKVRSMTDEDLQRLLEEDPENEAGPYPGWENTIMRGIPDFVNLDLPPQKKQLTIRLDEDIVDWFKDQGRKGYQTRINAVLRAFVDAQKTVERDG